MVCRYELILFFFFFQAEDGIRDIGVTGVQTCALPICTDITPDDNPYEAGLGLAVRLNKSIDFIGKSALAKAKQDGIRRRLRPLILPEPASITFGGEPVKDEGRVAGRGTGVGVSYTLGRSVAYTR